MPPRDGGERAGGGDVPAGGDPDPVVTGGLVELDEPSTG